jgi:hypothetical protein
MASTPFSTVIAVTPPEVVPCVATIITASPFCKLPSVAGGIRLRICWRSGAPPGRGPPGLPPEGGLPAGGAAPGAPPPAPAPFGGLPAPLQSHGDALGHHRGQLAQLRVRRKLHQHGLLRLQIHNADSVLADVDRRDRAGYILKRSRDNPFRSKLAAILVARATRATLISGLDLVARGLPMPNPVTQPLGCPI